MWLHSEVVEGSGFQDMIGEGGHNPTNNIKFTFFSSQRWKLKLNVDNQVPIGEQCFLRSQTLRINENSIFTKPPCFTFCVKNLDAVIHLILTTVQWDGHWQPYYFRAEGKKWVSERLSYPLNITYSVPVSESCFKFFLCSKSILSFVEFDSFKYSDSWKKISICYNVWLYKYDSIWVTLVCLGVWKTNINGYLLNTSASKWGSRIKSPELKGGKKSVFK